MKVRDILKRQYPEALLGHTSVRLAGPSELNDEALMVVYVEYQANPGFEKIYVLDLSSNYLPS
jgi:hypothetical protein